MTLSEKYRPAAMADIVGHDKIKTILGRVELGGRALWITGKSGTGKTTIARIVAAQIADPLYITETVGRQLTPTGLRDMANRWAYYPLCSDRDGYALIVNEAHGLSKPTIEVFLDVIEGLPSNVVIIFTTTNAGNDLFEEHIDAGPFRSRCLCLRLSERDISKPFAHRLREIAQLEHLDGQPESKYVQLVNRCHQNFRECLTEIEQGAMLDNRAAAQDA